MTDSYVLPDLCLDKIFDYLDSKTLVSCYRVNKQWRKVIIFTRRSRETLTESIDVGAEHKHLPLDALTKAKIETLDDFTLFHRFSSSLTHLEIDVDVSFEAVRRLRDTLTSLRLGPNVRHENWVDFWRDNARLEELEVVSKDTLHLIALPKTLKAFVAADVDVSCLQPCHQSLTTLKISERARGTHMCHWEFDRLKTLVLRSSDGIPRQAPVLERFEILDTVFFNRERTMVRKFIHRCNCTLTEVIAPGFDFFVLVRSFPNLTRLSVKSLSIVYRPCQFPALKTFSIFCYNQCIRYHSPFPGEAYELENFTVKEDYDYIFVLREPTLNNRIFFGERISRFLRTLRRLKSFEIDRSILTEYYLESIPNPLNLKRLRITNLQQVDLDLSRFAIELEELTITTCHELTVKLPSEGSIENLTLEGNVKFLVCEPIEIKRLTSNSFLVDADLLRFCSKRGLIALRIDTGEWETNCPESFFEALEDGVFTVYASVHENFREEFERKIKLACPSLTVCSFLCSNEIA